MPIGLHCVSAGNSRREEILDGLARFRELIGHDPAINAFHQTNIENVYAGAPCGIMDQFASACGEADRLLYLDCRSLTWQTVPLPQNVSIIVADTTVRRKLTSGEYNNRRNACEEAVRLLKTDLPGITALRDVSVKAFNRFSSKLPVEVEKSP